MADKVKACDLKNGTIVTVDKSKIDGVNYSSNTTNCQKSDNGSGGNGENGNGTGDNNGDNGKNPGGANTP